MNDINEGTLLTDFLVDRRSDGEATIHDGYGGAAHLQGADRLEVAIELLSDFEDLEVEVDLDALKRDLEAMRKHESERLTIAKQNQPAFMNQFNL